MGQKLTTREKGRLADQLLEVMRVAAHGVRPYADVRRGLQSIIEGTLPSASDWSIDVSDEHTIDGDYFVRLYYKGKQVGLISNESRLNEFLMEAADELRSFLPLQTGAFVSNDFQRLVSIVALRQKFITACEAILRAQADALAADQDLQVAIYGEVQFPQLEKVGTLVSTLTKMSSLRAEYLDGEFLLLDRSEGEEVFSFFDAEPIFPVKLVCEDERIAGRRELKASSIDTQAMKAVLWGADGEEDDHGYYPFYFAVIVDLNVDSPTQEVVVSTEQGDDDLIPCDRALGYIKREMAIA